MHHHCSCKYAVRAHGNGGGGVELRPLERPLEFMFFYFSPELPLGWLSVAWG
jgi:hypothetical protein